MYGLRRGGGDVLLSRNSFPNPSSHRGPFPPANVKRYVFSGGENSEPNLENYVEDGVPGLLVYGALMKKLKMTF